MKSKNIRIIVVLALATLVLLVVNQFYWVKKDFDFQENLIQIQKENKVRNDELFDSKVTLAMVNVRDKLLSLSVENSGLYLDPVKKVTDNYFVASFYDTINRDLLKNLLVEAFKSYHIEEVFEYGIYDCFTDSIIFDQYVDLSIGEKKLVRNEVPIQKWEHDGHYFGVYFPVEELTISEVKPFPRTLLLSSFAILVVIVIVGYAILVILKQKRLSEIKTDFINNMTHELKTPIATIKLSSDVLLKPHVLEDVDRVYRYANIIKAENNRLESQVERVLQVAKLEQDNIQLNFGEVDIHEVIRHSVEVYKLTVDQREGYISCDLDAEEFKVQADKVHITNIIHNVIDNGIKYSKENPLISIHTENKKKGIAISINDNGIGMTKEHTLHIFEKFYRVPKGSVHDVKGFGIGLFYVKFVVEEHGGKVTVESEVGKGSTFTIWLPL
ncbi:MAG: HAMP domain-containing histidine kinase [Flavobacteriales bacterium]|jgi:two-component system phosphate regulon sensor histidine kinase PhoR|nr:HAMP domain-containing histidine kinase [Flavobacteriales bacterium]